MNNWNTLGNSEHNERVQNNIHRQPNRIIEKVTNLLHSQRKTVQALNANLDTC